MSGEQPQSSSVIIAGPLVHYLRREVKQELAAIVTILQVEFDTVLDHEIYRGALDRFDEGRSLFDAIGLTDEDEPADLELDLARWPRLVLKTVESVYDAEVRRLQDAAAEERDLPMGDVPSAREPARGSSREVWIASTSDAQTDPSWRRDRTTWAWEKEAACLARRPLRSE